MVLHKKERMTPERLLTSFFVSLDDFDKRADRGGRASFTLDEVGKHATLLLIESTCSFKPFVTSIFHACILTVTAAKLITV